jgi:regulator of G-protein signaling
MWYILPVLVCCTKKNLATLPLSHSGLPKRYFKCDLLTSLDGTALFRVFLKNEYAEENLDFILKVQKYREASPKKRAPMAWKLYRHYIAIGAPHELNLDVMSRKVTDLSMITPHMSTFDASQKRIYNMLENDSYQRFLQWHIYLQLVRGGEDAAEDSGCFNETTL